MADKDFIVKNGIVANTSFSANSTVITGNGIYVTSAGVNSVSHTVGTSTVANSTGVYTGVVNGSSITVGTSTVANTTGVYTGVVNGSSITVGTSTVSNATGVYTTGTVNAASHTVGTSTVANATGVYTGIVNAASHTVGSTTVANATGVYVGSNVSVTTSTVNIGNATVNTAISAASISINGQSANGIGTTAGALIALDSSARIPAVNGALLTGVGTPTYSSHYTNAAAGQAKPVYSVVLATGNVAIPSGVKAARIYTFGVGGGYGGATQASQQESSWGAAGGAPGNWGFGDTIINQPSGNLTFTFGSAGSNGTSYSIISRTPSPSGTPGNPGGSSTLALNGQTILTITASNGGGGAYANGSAAQNLATTGDNGGNSTLQGQYINPTVTYIRGQQYVSGQAAYTFQSFTVAPGAAALNYWPNNQSYTGWSTSYGVANWSDMQYSAYQNITGAVGPLSIGNWYAYQANLYGNMVSLGGTNWGNANGAALIRWFY